MPRLLLLTAIFLVCGCEISRPQPSARESPLLVDADPPPWESLHPLRDERGEALVWLDYEEAGPFVRDIDGAITTTLPALEEPNGMRVLSRESIWVCGRSSVAFWNGVEWHHFEEDFSQPGTTTLGCDGGFGGDTGIDARGPDDAWVWDRWGACHYDGAAWECREKGDAGIALTREHTWLQESTAESEIVVLDLDGNEVARISPSFFPDRLIPVPGAERVIAERFAAQDGDPSPSDPELFDLTGRVRTFAPDASGYHVTVPVSADEAYVVSIDVEIEDVDCGLFGCSYEHRWSQLVVHRYEGEADTELAHFVFGPERTELARGAWVYLREGRVVIEAVDGGWYTVP
jgi:hypothetical protein